MNDYQKGQCDAAQNKGAQRNFSSHQSRNAYMAGYKGK